MILVIDTETNGLPRNYKAPISDFDNWPRLVQVAWAFFGEAGVQFGGAEHIIKPDGFTIPAKAAKVHGISTKMAKAQGIPLQDVLSRLTAAVNMVSCIVGHNISFDQNILGAEFLRCGMENVLLMRPHICTMKTSTDYCKLPGKRRGYKWPKLEEVYRILFKSEIESAHTAMADVEATGMVFFELQRLGIIPKGG